MAKKYLLYIHHPKFAEESKKSELVNDLLDKHYGHESDAYLLSPKQAKENPEIVKTFDKLAESIKPCKHGYDPKMCKFAKNGKECK